MSLFNLISFTNKIRSNLPIKLIPYFLLSVFFNQTALADEKVKHLTWAHVYELSEPLHLWAKWAAKEIEKETNGRYVINVFPSSIMGKEGEINQSLSLGTVDIIYTGTSFAGQTYPPMTLSELPYIFRDYQHWQNFNKSALFDDIALGYKNASMGNQVVGNNYYGQRHVTSSKPIRTPDDMIDLKLRVPNASIYKMFPLAVGANPSPIAFSEVYLALQQGVVDAQENPLPTIKAKKFYEVQKYINLTGHLQGSVLTVTNDKLWSSLTPKDKAIFTDVFKRAALGVSEDTRQAELALQQWFEAQGVTVISVDRGLFREKVLPSHQNVKQALGATFYDRLQNIQ
ncbi:sialic acid TRAP transporter substrate-binding protein SiaP [Colwellia sp. E2M01]|uniref:sialic acid TRAP transporter substrate-binding protein SiaP n=1 Tax=Colwellia sp. E2M01 TaxID=2841561 RepID=UPI001C08CAED|nr:sialic acid TRAP transporter substrate-binding protein SiaP [Colwellia sp. E2M01]MBU2869722.1 sialic acid TRAP transporter substrate-binding protein SiaP [Colwellia sp. E2M01]